MTKRAAAASAAKVKTLAARRKSPPRIRRTAEEAHRHILEATERRLIEGGPEAVRLQDIAADVGISHPAILHHFGSREGLLAALAERAIQGLERELLAILATRQAGDPPAIRAERAHAMFERINGLWTERGYARLFAGLILSGRKMQKRMKGIFQEFAQAMHENRVKRRIEDGKPAPSWEDTTFSLTMVWIALFGEALFGPIARATVGLADDFETGRRFRRWMAYRIEGLPAPGAASISRESARRRRARSRGSS
jgi:AcrR family transcriptional regulator